MPMTAAEKLEYARHHLVYEVEMVFGLVGRFRRFTLLLPRIGTSPTAAEREVTDLVGRNADIESFAIHSRNLVDFLYGRKPSLKDCHARDYFPDKHIWARTRPTRPRSLLTVPERASIEVVHLSYDREHPAVPWDYDAIWNDLSSVLRFFAESADEGLLGRENKATISRLVTTNPDSISVGPTGVTLSGLLDATTAAPVGIWEDGPAGRFGPTGPTGPTVPPESMPGTAIMPPANARP